MKLITFFICLCLVQSQVPSPCLNSKTFTFYYAGMDRDCQNIRIDDFRREQLCIFEEVSQNCPQTCGLCCEDDGEYEFKIKRRTEGKPRTRVTKKCKWLGNKVSRQEKYCRTWSLGSMVSKACNRFT